VFTDRRMLSVRVRKSRPSYGRRSGRPPRCQRRDVCGEGVGNRLLYRDGSESLPGVEKRNGKAECGFGHFTSVGGRLYLNTITHCYSESYSHSYINYYSYSDKHPYGGFSFDTKTASYPIVHCRYS
jgi:hypothetical protein